MRRIQFLESSLIDRIREFPNQPADPELIEAVDEAIATLGEPLADIVRARYFEGLPLAAISDRLEMEEKEIMRSLYEARRLLKSALAGFVERRWGIRAAGLCRVCAHPRREEIERVIERWKGHSWGRVCGEVEKAVGEWFHPPQILKAHIKHKADQGAKR